ncbi:hypothetical protein DVH24_017944 [Malus domestica]|uniref:PB1-like domain-containing protein n=1 Tax=Malus domestica TaxID=3750 RepID=A0A498KJV9_MALDO|nr:hypothetical protein DVH24_017944 [Malus domestica]
MGKIVVKPSLVMGWEKRRIEVGETPLYCMPELFSLKINHGGKWSESAYTGRFEAWFDYVDKDFKSFFEIDEMVKELGYDGFMLYHYRIPGMSYCEGLRLIERDQNVGEMCKYVPGGSGSKLKKGRAKGGRDDLEKWLCLLNDIAYNGDDEHEAEATKGGQGSGNEAEYGHLNADDEGDETEEGHKAEEVNEGTEVEANEDLE